MRNCERWYFWLVLKLEKSYRVIISWRILVSFRGFFLEDNIFVWWNIWVSINSSFFLKIIFNVKVARPKCDTHPLFSYLLVSYRGYVCQNQASQKLWPKVDLHLTHSRIELHLKYPPKWRYWATVLPKLWMKSKDRMKTVYIVHRGKKKTQKIREPSSSCLLI